MHESICSLFSSGRWSELIISAFLTIKYRNAENLIFQHLPLKEKIFNQKNNRWEEVNRMTNGVKIDTLTTVGIVDLVKCGGIIFLNL